MMGNVLLLIDGGDLTARCYHGAWPSGTVPSMHNYKMVFRVIQSVTASLEQWKPTSVALVCDSDNGSYDRKRFWSGYKAKRVPDEIFRHHRRFAIELLTRTMPMHVLKRSGFEADDLLAQLCAKTWSRRVIILTGDHDLLQVRQAWPERVTVYSPVKRQELLIEDPSIDFRKLKALIGDVSDNIPSVTGPVTAKRLLHAGGKLEAWLDGGVTRSEKIPRRKAYERNLRLVSLIGSECLVPKIALPDIESKVRKHDLSFLRHVCMDILRPKLFDSQEMDRIERTWRTWYAQRLSEGHGIAKQEDDA